MSFKDLSNIQMEYRTLLDNVIKDFYIPALCRAREYRRSVGFFSSSILLQLTHGLSSLAKNGGKMKLLVSPRIDEKDYEAIEKGYKSLEQVAEENVVNNFDEFIEFENRDDRYGLLSYMIRTGFLEIKIVALEKNNNSSLYHEKLGIISDEEDNYIAFSGSANESSNAFNDNYEAIDVFCSWKSFDSELRCEMKVNAFDRMWSGNEKGLITIPFPTVIKEKLLKYENSNKKDYTVVNLDENWLEEHKKKKKMLQDRPTLNDINLREYQIEAIDNWKNSGFRGIFDMATGTGKTFTALGAIVKLFEEKKRVFVIVCCPYIHLVDQWCKEASFFNISAIKCYGGSEYKDKLRREAVKFRQKRNCDFVCAITANKTFCSDFFQKIVDENLSSILLVVDEAHNFGADQLSFYLNKDFKYRLALSATLDRYGDEEGTKKLYDFFGEKNIEYSLEKAIVNGMLTEYVYKPVLVNLTEDELEEYLSLSSKIGKLMHGDKKSDALKKLLLKRARLIAGAKNKVKALLNIIKDYEKKNNILIYCGAVKYGEYDYDDCPEEIKQINLVVKKLNLEHHMKVSKFTSAESSSERDAIIKAFKMGDLQALVAIKCLDEGVNIPAIDTAFILASSTNPKEYIQRRGRVLRLSENKKYATIYDFITVTRELEEVNNIPAETLHVESSLIKKELIRYTDFALLAKNGSECNELLNFIKEAYKLDVITEEDFFDEYY